MSRLAAAGAAAVEARRTVKDAISLTTGAVSVALGGSVVAGDPACTIGGFSIDSRTLAPGSLFFAIPGERFDGHAFVGEAMARGACGVVVSRPLEGLPSGVEGACVVRVDDVVLALQQLASHVRQASGTRVVAITGSAGKTTTKEMAATLLSARYAVFRNEGNLNNHIGLPLSLLELRHRPDVAVVELGMNHAGEISRLVAIARPDARVWTNVGEAHLGFFASIEAIADAKAEILEGAAPATLLIANAGDARVMARARGFAGRLVTFGVETPADVSAVDVRDLGLEGSLATLRTPAGEADLQVPLAGRGHLANALAAAAVALEHGVGLATVVERIAELRPAARRGEVLRLPGGVTLLDDAYNSNPSALRMSLETVRTAKGCARRAAVLGEMLELGEQAASLHAECGRAAAAAGLDWLVTVGGPAAGALGRAAVEAGLAESAVRHVPESEAAARLAATLARPGDLVLVKGSRGIRLERVVERLRAEFA